MRFGLVGFMFPTRKRERSTGGGLCATELGGLFFVVWVLRPLLGVALIELVFAGVGRW